MQLIPSPETHGSRAVEEIARDGYSIIPRFLSAEEVAALAAEAEARYARGDFREAGVGRGAERRVRPEIRGDHVLWLEEEELAAPATIANGALRAYAEFLELLRGMLNQAFFLGLVRFEGHFTRYPAGAFYRTHHDNFRGAGHRMVTALLYLNADWEQADGGLLRLYLEEGPDAPHRDIAPEGGTLLMFDAARFPHEVLPAARPRLSLTGWFCRRE